MTALREEVNYLVKEIPDESLKNFLPIVKYFLSKEDPFWSEENQEHLKKAIDDMNNGRNVVKFTSEEWENFKRKFFGLLERQN